MNKQVKEKIKFTERFKRHYSLRGHMSLILLATLCSGLLATRIMLAMHLENVLVRYPLAVIFAYGTFFVSIKLWLKYIEPSPPNQKIQDSPLDGLDVPDFSISGSSDGGVISEVFSGSGGAFDGAGASGVFEEVGSAVADTGSDMVAEGIDAGGSALGDAVGEAAGEAVSALGDELGVVAVVVFAALAAVMALVVGTGLYLIYEAPVILSEAAFEVILAASLLRGTRRISSGDWMGSIFKTTRIAFAATLALAILAGYLMHHYFPGVTRISDLLAQL